MEEKEGCVTRCSFERAAEVEFRALNAAVREVQERLGRLESTLMRGAALLMANLAGMAATLAGQLLGK
ncbi:MAG TPA: hypothetical protein PLY90_09895 [Candidatus Hydrogenedentes bacterium]|jgi:hypothetical protein|nr:MAG: hypothetical protein BWY07_02170 [Candidatus Hydrogenedentes bacterium ADurb.Bin170]HNZ49371.1 hypothetical protein [Candidatus Hydrogenedentota bacterium]HOD96544.1 hypothetical protein [Candidatus Hydrogenedentota bacterium]HOM49208.1 hypothetical protein [Candidatus Hydrogenedentota bacterium]HOR51936.1 hypothetical protein [Candidatus Hydrogenedentota bacterium]